MKMKKACEATGLTERAIRLYLQRGLLAPKQENGILDFSPEDIDLLRDIALLRQFDFPIEQISRMINNPSVIAETVKARLEGAFSAADHQYDVGSILNEVQTNELGNISKLAAEIRIRSMGKPVPDFGRFDEISEETRQHARQTALRQLDREERKKQWLKGGIIVLGCTLLTAFLLGFYLAHPRLQGFISFSPFTIADMTYDTICVVVEREELVELLGCDRVTVPYRAHGVPLSIGDKIESGCQLAFDISNYDLLRLGINPLQSLQTSSEEVNRQWLRVVIRKLFSEPIQDEAVLWIREYNPAQFRQWFLWDAE